MRYQLDFSQALKDLDGKGIRLGGLSNPDLVAALNDLSADFEEERRAKLVAWVDEIFGKEQTLSSVCVAGLLSPHEDEKKLGEDERVRRFELARRLNKGGVQEFNDKERDLLKMVVGKRFLGNLIAPTVWELIEGAERKTEVKAVA